MVQHLRRRRRKRLREKSSLWININERKDRFVGIFWDAGLVHMLVERRKLFERLKKKDGNKNWSIDMHSWEHQQRDSTYEFWFIFDLIWFWFDLYWWQKKKALFAGVEPPLSSGLWILFPCQITLYIVSFIWNLEENSNNKTTHNIVTFITFLGQYYTVESVILFCRLHNPRMTASQYVMTRKECDAMLLYGELLLNQWLCYGKDEDKPSPLGTR